MAIRNIREMGDEVLNKTCKEVTQMTPRIMELIEDMVETMYEANGVGLAAPQVGIVKQVVVIDDYEGNVLALINPKIEQIGTEMQTSTEGCLSLPGYSGNVQRPKKVRVTALDETGEEIEIIAEDMLAVILSHEIDHLSGTLYKDKAENYGKIESQEG